jgi:two-component system, LuxR family, response regulator FixJ
MSGQSDVVPIPATVVIVDDDPAVRNSLKFCLEVEGFYVRAYANAADLLRDSGMPKAGCLVIDYNLPATNGLDLLVELRRRNVALPAILITSQPSFLVRTRAAAAGAALIEKPLLNEALFEEIRSALSRPNS